MAKVVRGWPRPAVAASKIRLELGGGDGEDPKHNLSAGTRIDDTLFVAGDEDAVVERLVKDASGRWTSHDRFQLAALLDLLQPEAEVDIEGLCAADGWLWVVGSHARARNKPDKSADACIDLAMLADLKDTRPRCLLARLPLVAPPDRPGVLHPVRRDGERRAGMIRQTKRGSKLAEMLRADLLLAPFAAIPAKEGGIDIEGIAVAGNRLALGMRGPVIRNHALLLEVSIAATTSGRLKLDAGPVKRLLDLEGLGIRDLKLRGPDLLILAGPTTSLDGPCALYCWRDWVADVASDEGEVKLHRPERLFDLPFGRGVDHPEGLSLWEPEDGRQRILVLCDSPDPARFEDGAGIFLADLFDLPD